MPSAKRLALRHQDGRQSANPLRYAAPVRFADTLPPLLVATLLPGAIISAAMMSSGSMLTSLFLVLYIWPFTLVTTTALVVPILVLRPHLRAPSLKIATLWGLITGGLGGLGYLLMLGWRSLFEWQMYAGLLGFMGMGIASGLSYAITARATKERRQRRFGQ
jgi:hypothetical protein